MIQPAPLVAITEAPVPLGGHAEWFRGLDGAYLRAALFPASVTTRGSVVLSPGRTEPIEKYFEVVADLQQRGWTVLVHDWRGQGLSHRALNDRYKGHARNMAEFVDDFSQLLAQFDARLPRPWLAMGHSMGGCLTALVLDRGERRFAGAILSAPMFGVQTGAIPLWLARLLASTMSVLGQSEAYVFGDPGQPMGGPFASNALTHDESRYARSLAQLKANPDLALGSPTWGWLSFALNATRWLKVSPGLRALDIPVIVLSAGEDRLVDNKAQRTVTQRIPKGRWLEVAGAYHEILQETDALRGVFWQAFDALAETISAPQA